MTRRNLESELNIASNLRRRGRVATASAEATTELGREFTRGSTTLFSTFTSIATTVSTLTFTTIATATSTASTRAALTVISTNHTLRWGVRSLLLDVCGGNNLGREMEPFTEVIQTLGSETVVIVLP